MASPSKQEDEVQEEDWSDFMTTDLSSGFAQHGKQEISLLNGCTLRIASASALSPLDMVNLSWGTHDATGHCIWMGARLFLQALPKLKAYLLDQRVLELGSGTGLAGISVSKFYSIKYLTLTDSSDSALRLCRENVAMNFSEGANQNLQVKKLSWGESLPEKSVFDTVLATDVLYDIQSWDPLLQTTINSLQVGGVLLLSHVPRAALPPSASAKSLEEYLIARARSHELHLQSTLCPRDLSENFDVDMQQAGAAILIFEKKK